MQFELKQYNVGAWALPALINDDWSGLDDGDEVMLTDWIEWATDDWTDADDNTLVFGHWGSVSQHNEFGMDEITHHYGECYTLDAMFRLKPRS